MTPASATADIALRAACPRWLCSHGPMAVREVLGGLQREAAAELPADHYGLGGAVERLEETTAVLLGKPAATFFIKGMIAQTALLRTVAEARPGAVVVPAFGHMAIDEAKAVHHLLGCPVLERGGDEGLRVDDLEAVPGPLAACVVELPLRRAAYRLMPLTALQDLSAWCRARGVHLHIDGARLWEAAAGYGVSPAELAALADSIYVSFYKGLGGLAGAVLAGDEALLERVAVWKTRFGGNLHTAYPYALSALAGLDLRLARMPGYVARARTLAAVLDASGVRCVPAVPDVNAFQVILPGAPEALAAANRAFARGRGIWLFNAFLPADNPDLTRAEIVIGDAAEGYDDAEAAGWIADLLKLAALAARG